LEGFWPSSNWRFNYARASLSTMMDIVDPKYLIQVPYYGPKNMRPLTRYMSFGDLNVENFVFVKPHDPDGCLHTMVTLYGCHNGNFFNIP
jgi:hypothetical protein